MDISYYKKYEPIFDSWKIVREIGEGSFGKVFEIEREDFGYTYKAALKAITIPQSQSEVKSALADGMDKDNATAYFRGFVEEMVGEFVMMSQLKGISNIVSYEDHRVVEHNDGIGWDILIRMEKLTPLIDFSESKPLPRDEVIKLGIDMCKALEACRTCNIIHRDIKPENIFVSKLGDYKLGDFGIAKTVEKTTGGLSKKGTYTYMAPEVYKGEKYGSSVDIYSLGIVLYRYLNNNRTPFLPDSSQPIKYIDRETALARRVGGEEIPAPVNADAELAKIILKACAYNPKDRYSSPAEMREALEAVASGNTITMVQAPKAEVGGDKSTAAEDSSQDSATVGIFGRGVPIVAEENNGKGLSLDRAETVKEVPVLPQRLAVQIPKPVQPAPQRPAAQIPKPVQPAPQRPAVQIPKPVQPAPQRPAVQIPKPVQPAPQKKTHSVLPILCVSIAILIAVVAVVAVIRSAGGSNGSSHYKHPTPFQSDSINELFLFESSVNRSSLTEISFSDASASSQIYYDGILYSAKNVIDGRDDTSWQEDAPDDGEGEFVNLAFDGETEISYLAILPGYAANNDFYYSNSRPKDILIEFSDGQSCTYTLPDSNSYITLELSDTVSTTYVRITILSVYAGDKWDDTAISEVIAYR